MTPRERAAAVMREAMTEAAEGDLYLSRMEEIIARHFVEAIAQAITAHTEEIVALIDASGGVEEARLSRDHTR